MSFKFEKLKIWQLSLELADEIHRLTRFFPREEMFSLTSQIKRAADSVSLNIVEGSTGLSDKEFRRFLHIANRSALEVVGCLYLARRRNYISDEIFSKYYTQTETLVKMIQAFINSLN